MIARQRARSPANDAKLFVGYHLAPSLWNHYKVIDRRRPTNDTHVGQSLVRGSIGYKKSWVSLALVGKPSAQALFALVKVTAFWQKSYWREVSLLPSGEAGWLRGRVWPWQPA